VRTRHAFQAINGLEATYLADKLMSGGELVNVLWAYQQQTKSTLSVQEISSHPSATWWRTFSRII
jgi:hypothetical protein